jgi:type VI secretion system secreted protein Hcp
LPLGRREEARRSAYPRRARDPREEATMALNAYLRLSGATQGEIKGSVTQAGREDAIMVIAASHELATAIEHRGRPTGKRQHHPMVLTKEVDRATPLLYTALVNNERMSSWRLEFWQPSRSGREVQHYTIDLIGARLIDVKMEMLDNRRPENMSLKEREHLTFAYEKIAWTWMDGGIRAEDDWEAPNA